MKALALVTLGVLGACSAPTELLLVVQGNLSSSTLSAVQVQVTESAGADLAGGFSQAPICVCVDSTVCMGNVPQATMPLTIPLEPGHQGTTPFEIDVHGYAGPDCSVDMNDFIDASAVVQFVPHKRLAVDIALDEECLGVACQAGETCNPATGTCHSNMVTGMPIGDMGTPATPPDVGTDLSSSDMASPPAFKLLSSAPTLWNVALGNGQAALGYIGSGAMTSFSYGVLVSGSVSGFLQGTLPAAAVDVCAVYDSLNERFVFGVSTQTTVTMFTTGAAMGGPGTQIFTTQSGSVSQLQCARSADGIVFAWLSTPAAVPVGGGGANGAPAHPPGSSAPMIALVDVVTASAADPVRAPTLVAPANGFHLAPSGFSTGSTGVPISVLFVPDGVTYTNSGNKTCGNSVLLTYATPDFGKPAVTCVPIEAGKGPVAVATGADHSAVVGVKSGNTTFSNSNGTPAQTISSSIPGQVAIVPVGPLSFAIAFSAQGSHELDLFSGSAAGVPPLSTVVVTTDAITSLPIELASDDGGRTLVTWVDESGALFGELTP